MSIGSGIGIVGYGRFGSALAALLQERGHVWRGWDPVVEVSGDHRVGDLDTLLAQSDLIIVAVPVSALPPKALAKDRASVAFALSEAR